MIPRTLASILALALTSALAGTGCWIEGEPACNEDVRAQVLDETVAVDIGGYAIEAELADEAVERERGWKHRRCGGEGLLLVPDDPPAPLPVWGCGLVDGVDAYFLADGVVVDHARLEPCAEPCSGCPSAGEGLEVDAVLELPAGAYGDPFEPGTPVSL